MSIEDRIDANLAGMAGALTKGLSMAVTAAGAALAGAARLVLGWGRPVLEEPVRQSAVVVFEHTSRWDFLVLLLGMPTLDADVYTLVKPQLFEGLLGAFLGPILFALGCLPGPRLEDRGTGSVKAIAEGLKRIAESAERPVLFCMSPKGTVQAAEWRSGYRRIAEALQWPVRPAAVCFQSKSIRLGAPIAAESSEVEDALKSSLATAVPYRPERSLLFKGRHDVFELLAPWDLTTVSLLALVPPLHMAYRDGPYLLPVQALATAALCVAFEYHRSKERLWHTLDAVLAKSTIAVAVVRAVALHGPFWTARNCGPTGALAVALYYAGVPRTSDGGPRGPYVVWHSLFHVAAGLLAAALLQPQ